MPPLLTRLHDHDARQPSADDYDPARITVSLAVLLDGDTPSDVRLSSDNLLDSLKKVQREDLRLIPKEDAIANLRVGFHSPQGTATIEPQVLSSKDAEASIEGSSDSEHADEAENVGVEPRSSPSQPSAVGKIILRQLHGKALTPELHKQEITPAGEPTRTTSIRLVHAASGRTKAVKVTTDKVPILKNSDQIIGDVDDVNAIHVSNITDAICSQLPERSTIVDKENESSSSNDSTVCEAVLRSVFAPKLLGESANDNHNVAEAVKKAFALPGSLYTAAESRAIHVAHYRRAEVQAKLESLRRDEDNVINPLQFEDRSLYENWKEKEAEELSELVTYLGTLPSFSGSVQVDIMSADDLKPANQKWISQLQCSRGPPSFQVYCSVTILPTKPGTVHSDFADSGDGAPRIPAFLSEVVMCAESAEWQGKSPWIPISSKQDRILIEVWERIGADKINLKDGKMKTEHGMSTSIDRLRRRSNKSRKVAPWSGDFFLGEVIVSFNHIESKALGDGGLQGTTPVTSYMLVDEKGRQHTSTIQLQFACSCEHFYRDAPPNKLLLKPPVEDVEKAYDHLIQIAFQAEKEDYELGGQWKKVIKDFTAHYRLRKERCALGLVRVLAGKFSNNAQYLSAIVNEWSLACTAAKEGTLTKSERAIHSNIAATLVKPAVEAIENFQTTFAGNQPTGALSKLLELLALILRWDPNPIEIVIPLRSWIEVSCEKRLRQNLLSNTEGEKLGEISLQSLIETVKLVRSDIAEHRTTYEGVFPTGLVLPAVTSPTYYKLVSQYTRSFVVAAPVKTFTREYGDLASELLFLHKDIEAIGVRLMFLDVHHLFKDSIAQWLATLKLRMVDWVISLCRTEKWEPLSPQTNAFFSFSLVDLYSMMIQIADELTSRLLLLPFGNQYVWGMEAAICAAVQLYAGLVEKLCLQDLSEQLIHEEQDSIDHRTGIAFLSVSKSLCIKLNNINAVSQQQQDLESYLDEKWLAFTQHLAGKNEDPEDLSLKEDVAVEERFSSLNSDDHVEHKVGEKFKELGQILHHSSKNVIGSIVESMQGQLKTQLQSVFRWVDPSDTIEDQMEPLTKFLDQNITVMNEWLHPCVFQQILNEIAKALFFCMEEFVFNKDVDPKPISLQQRKKLEESLRVVYDYFHGDGLGLTSAQMDQACGRLRTILACWDMSTGDLCSQYWHAWDKFNESTSQEPDASGNITLSAEGGFGDNASTCEAKPPPREKSANSELHLLDYLWLLKQRDDDEAKELIKTQDSIVTERTMQFFFGLPRDEGIIASYTCRNATRKDGTLYITSKHIGFAEINVAAAHDPQLLLLPLERLMRVTITGSKGTKNIVLFPFNLRPQKFSKISDPEAVCHIIYGQVLGSGIYLEKSMAPLWGGNQPHPGNAIREFQCCKHGVLRNHQGVLLMSTTHVIFERKDTQKKLLIDHGSISHIHAGRKGLRPSGVVIELKHGEQLEFVDFANSDLSMAEIAQEMQKLVLTGTVKSDRL